MRLRTFLPLAAATAALGLPALAQEVNGHWRGELRAHLDPRSANERGLLARADALSPGLAPPARSGATIDLGLRGQARSLAVDVLLRHERREGGDTDTTARFNELYASGPVPGVGDAWQFSAGKKIVSWDVGYGWRPNDVVQQEERRQLLSATAEGRPLLQLEHFGAESAWALVWVNPHHLHAPFSRTGGGEESALALRYYLRHGAADWHGFARWGEHTSGSVGAAFAWVASESLELHASWRFTQRHDGWRYGGPPGAAPSAANPWALATQGAATQWLLGFSWTNEQQLSLLGEAWHDGTALSDDHWSHWLQRCQGLLAAGRLAPAPLRTLHAANAAWQATPWRSPNLRRDNLFLRLAWQHEAWQPALDMLFTPRDAGRTWTASLAWQGDRLKLEAGLRHHGGPATALLAQLPLDRSGYLLASLAF
ncbi:MAG: hypothetical protein AB1430_19825 [Pseudomonadota bacterium]